MRLSFRTCRTVVAITLSLTSTAALASGTPELAVFIFLLVTLLPGLILGVLFAMFHARLGRALGISAASFIALFGLATYSNFTPGYSGFLVGLIGCLPLGLAVLLSYATVRAIFAPRDAEEQSPAQLTRRYHRIVATSMLHAVSPLLLLSWSNSATTLASWLFWSWPIWLCLLIPYRVLSMLLFASSVSVSIVALGVAAAKLL
jgi:hypothetical protein